LRTAHELSVRDVDRNFCITGGITICGKGETLTVNDGKVAGTNFFLILNVVHAEPIHSTHPCLGKLEGHRSQVAI
jgi:hypothetical protein